MKRTLLYIAAALTGAASFTACDNDFEVPPVTGNPFETVETNFTLADFKTEYWSALSASTTVGYDANGDTIIFKGRVCSSDKSGNVYKNVYIQSVDENGQQIALTFAVNAYDIYEKFPYGQEVAVKATGLEIGNFRTLLQIGAQSGSSMTFMDESTFLEHVVPTAPFSYKDSVIIDVTTPTELNALRTDPQQVMLWQSRLVKLEGVSFVDAGQPCATSRTEDRYVVDAQGGRLDVRMSAYSDFKENLLPYGTGNVTGLLGMFDNSWQLTVIDFDALEDFTGEGGEEPGGTVEPEGEGTVESPYNVARTLELIRSGNITEDKVYVKGKISSIKEIDASNYGNASYYIKDENGSEDFYIFRGYALGNKHFTSTDELEVGADVVVYGQLINYMGNTPEMAQGNYIYSYNGNTGGTTGGETGEAKGDGTVENPYNVAKTLQLITSGNITEDKVYVTGVISSIKEIDTGTYGNASYYIKDENGSAEFYIFRGYALGNKHFTSADEIAAGATVVVYGQLINYMGNTPEMAQGNYIYSYNGQIGETGGETPDPNPKPDPTPGTPEGAIAASALTVPGTTTVDGGYTITIAQAGGASTPVYNANTSAVRLYAGNTITIEGSELKTITFNLASDAGFRYTTVTASTGTVGTQAVGDTSFTWTGDATSVTFTVGEQATLGSDGESAKGQIRFSSLNIN